MLLKQECFTAKAFRELVSGVARTMYSFKSHPAREERNRVALEVIEKYPHLKTPGSNSAVSP